MPEREPSMLHLLIPGLLDRVAEWQADYGDVGRHPHLEWLLARAAVRDARLRGREATLAALFGLPEPVPAGALTRFALTGDTPEGWWLCIDPVHLEPGIADLVLTGPSRLGVSRVEADALAARINDHLAPEGLAVDATAPGHWHLRLPGGESPPRTDTLGEVLGLPINAHLPEGESARIWRRRINEIQMLLFDAPENRAREREGRPTVNSVWPWGAGALPRTLTAPAEQLYGDDPLLVGLAACADVQCAPLPDTAEAVLEAGGTRLAYLDVLAEDAAHDDLEGWQAGMDGLERTWFAPLRHALGSARLRRLVIHSSCGPVFELGSGARWRSWRRSRPLGGHLPGAAS